MNRRWRNHLARRGQFLTVPVGAPARSASIVDAAGTRPRSVPRPSRGRFFSVPPTAAPPVVTPWTPGITEQAGMRPRRASIRRGCFLSTPPAPPPAVQPWTPGLTQQAGRRCVRARDGRFFPSPVAQPWTPGIVEPSGNRPRWTSIRRGRFFPMVAAPPAAPPPPVVQLWIGQAGNRPRWAVARSGAFFPTPSAPAPIVQPWTPGLVQPHRLRGASVRRGRFLPAPQSSPVVGLRIEQSGVRRPATRRGFFLPVPPKPVVVPALPLSLIHCQGQRRPLPVRHGSFLIVLAPAVPPLVPPALPAILRPLRRLVLPVRGGNLATPVPAPPSAPVTGPPVATQTRPRGRAVQARRRTFLTVPLVGLAAPAPGFACQDFSCVVTADAYSATASADAYSATTALDAYSTAVTPDTYSGVATNCGR